MRPKASQIVRYIGSKTATLPWLSRMVAERAPAARSLCDPFAGTCVVARHFKSRGLRIVTGDVLELSYAIQRATIELDRPPSFEGLNETLAQGDGANPLGFLNALPGEDGYFSENFSPAKGSGRHFFTAANAARIDAIRRQIFAWKRDGAITDVEASFLLAALISAADKVANTAGTYYAHLKAFTRKALLPLRLVAPPTTPLGGGSECHQLDARALVGETSADILYLDPPYNGRNYARYYHLPETLANGTSPSPTGKSGAPAEVGMGSDFYRRGRATAALEQLCERANARHIVVHYTTHGIIPHDSVLDLLRRRGETRFDDFAVRAYSATQSGAARQAQHRVYWCNVSRGGG